MHVVTARVHGPRLLRGKLQPSYLGNGQGIDIGAEGQAAKLCIRADIHHEAGVREALRLKPVIRKDIRDVIGGFHLLVRRFRIAVDMAPPRDDLRTVSIEPLVNKLRDHAHASLLLDYLLEAVYN